MFGQISGRIGGPVFLVLGLALLVFGFRSALETHTFVRSAVRTEGIVSKLNAGELHPQIDFTTMNNMDISYPQGGLVFGLRPGEKVEVLFDAGNPAETATVNTVGAVWFTTLMLSGLGALSILMGTLAWLSKVSPSGQICL